MLIGGGLGLGDDGYAGSLCHAAAGLPERADDLAGLRSKAAGGNKLCHRHTVLGDQDALARCDCLQQPGQMGLGLVGAD